MQINILFPVWNEEKRLAIGIDKTINYLYNQKEFDYIITIVDNASSDNTREIAKDLEKKYDHVQYLRLEEKGVGIAVKEGILRSTSEIVGYMDIDLATDVVYLSKVKELYQDNAQLQIINASRFNKKSYALGRKWYRNITSYGFILLLKMVFNMKATDAICGFKFFKRETALNLISESSPENGWFYIVELLIRAERKKISIYELPVNWIDDAANSSVEIKKVISDYLRQIKRLYKQLKKENERT